MKLPRAWAVGGGPSRGRSQKQPRRFAWQSRTAFRWLTGPPNWPAAAPTLLIRARSKLREHARHLVHQRWGDGMKVEGQPFPPPDPPKGLGNKGWTAVLLIAGGVLLWTIGCAVPL